MIKKALILTWNGFQDQEVIYPYYRLLEEGFNVKIATGPEGMDLDGKVTGIFGIKFDAVSLESFLLLTDVHFLVLPGGVKALEKLRQYKYALDFIHIYNSTGKTIASTCHGAQLLISAKVVKGRKISGYYSIKDDIENAGATYVDAPAVIDGNIVSSPHYKWMGEWMKTSIELYHTKEQND